MAAQFAMCPCYWAEEVKEYFTLLCTGNSLRHFNANSLRKFQLDLIVFLFQWNSSGACAWLQLKSF